MTSVPDRFPATGTDLGAAVTRVVTHHRIGMQLAFDGRLDPDLLGRAVRLSLDAEPILGCRFAPEARHGEWQRLGGLDDLVPFAVVTTDEFERDAVAFEAREIPDEGPQVEALLLRGTTHDELALKISHVLADGQAMKQYAYLLATLYTRLADDPSYVPDPNVAQRPTGADVWSHLTREQRKAAKKVASWAAPNWPVPSRAATGEGLTYRRLTIPPERLRDLKAYGKERGATVNDVLLAAYFRALVSRLDPPKGTTLTLMNTADHRRYLPATDGLPIANLSISGTVGVPRVDGEAFDDTLRRIRQRTAEWASACHGAAAAASAEKLARLGYGNIRRLMGLLLRPGGGGKSMPFLTNIGVVDVTRLAFAGADPVSAVMFGPSARGGGSFVATASTYRDRLSVVMGFCEADLDAGVIEGVLRSLDSEIPG